MAKVAETATRARVKEAERIERAARSEDPTLSRDTSRSSVETQLRAAWQSCQQDYIERIESAYTNWNAGFTKDGNRTFDFRYDRKTTVCRARMSAELDSAMSTGDFSYIDQLYVSVINGTLRHTGHSGRGTAPSVKDGCAVKRLVVDKDATEIARLNNPRAPAVKKEAIHCKRRMPRKLRTKAVVTSDAHDRRIKQCETACNDVWMGGHDPFAVLHILNNVDDKAVVPAWLTRPPTVIWESSTTANGEEFSFTLQLETGSGDANVEYALKYGFKPVAPVRTPADVLLTALETRGAADNIDSGVVMRMYNAVSSAMCQSIFQAVHKNWHLPLLHRNIRSRGFSFGGTRILRPASAENAGEYVFASRLEHFNARLNDDVQFVRVSPAEVKRVMSIRHFFDEFTVNEKKVGDQKVISIGRRYRKVRGSLMCIRLTPHYGKSSANPSRRDFWKYARDIVLWCEPCLRVENLMPPQQASPAAVCVHWISRYHRLLATGTDVPAFVRRYHKSFHAPGGGDESSASDSSSDDSEQDPDDQVIVEENEPVEQEADATRVRNRFYQTALDAMMSAQAGEAVDDGYCIPAAAAAGIANPAGFDFQADWLRDRPVNADHVRRNYLRLVASGADEAAHAPLAALAGRQRVLPAVLKRYLTEQRKFAYSSRVWNAYDKQAQQWRLRSSRQVPPVRPEIVDQRLTPPKPLRAFLLGDPGAGKSFTLRSAMHGVNVMLADDFAKWSDVVKLSAPTGCASFHMAHGATTIHRLYAIRVGQTGDDPLPTDSQRFSKLCERLTTELGLIIFDEFSMIQRRMIRWVVHRLGEAGVNMDHIGVLFVGDPAQILPIGDAPVWSLRQRSDDGKECSEASILGMAAFRELFRMPALDTLPGYETWRTSLGKNPADLSDSVRAEVARFRASAYDGDFETVYLNEVRRTVENDEVATQFTGDVLPSMRYGKATPEKIQWLKDNCATARDMSDDPAWKMAVKLHGYHWFSEWASFRETVESDNAKALVNFAEDRGAHVMAVNSQHLPVSKARKLQGLSAKEFRGVSSVLFACSGLPLMLLENVAPSVGLFNGAQVEFVGPLYLDDELQVTISRRDYDAKVRVDGVTLSGPVDTPHSNRDHVHQVPVGSVILKVNGIDLEGDASRLDELVALADPVQLVVRTPMCAPHLPEFIVVRVPSYTANGGLNVLNIDDADDLVPIRAVKRGRANPKSGCSAAEQQSTEFRVGFPLEGGNAFTGFKGQGATLARVEVKVKEWVATPGFWTVVVSRVKHPKHMHIPNTHWPSAQEINVQRLNDDVIEAEIFERQMRINAAKTWRHHVALEGGPEWSREENLIADAIHKAWRVHRVQDVAESVIQNLSTSGAHVQMKDVVAVLNKMLATEESLILAKPIYLTQSKHRQLFMSLSKRKQLSTSTSTRTKRKAPTSANRGKSAKRGRTAGGPLE